MLFLVGIGGYSEFYPNSGRAGNVISELLITRQTPLALHLWG